MSFSSDVKEELEKKIDSAKHCQIAEIAAIMALSGNISWQSDGNIEIIITTENKMVTSKFIALIDKAFSISEDKCELFYEGKKNSIINLYIKNQECVAKILMAIKWSDEKMEVIQPEFVHKLIVQKECCKRAFIRGAFLAAGSISDPNKFYHFEIVCGCEEDAQILQEMLAFFKLDAKVIQRKKNFIVYLKEGNNITDVLNVCGAYVSQMQLFNVMILKGMRNDVNRKVNCETANLNKTVEAAVKQIRDIEYVRDTIGLENLNDGLRDVAYLRLENPDMNLKNLGEMLNPAVGKSGVNHRLRKISQIADELRQGQQ